MHSPTSQLIEQMYEAASVMDGVLGDQSGLRHRNRHRGWTSDGRDHVRPSVWQVTMSGDEGNRTPNPRLAKAVPLILCAQQNCRSRAISGLSMIRNSDRVPRLCHISTESNGATRPRQDGPGPRRLVVPTLGSRVRSGGSMGSCVPSRRRSQARPRGDRAVR
jgi:hypothetical protein